MHATVTSVPREIFPRWFHFEHGQEDPDLDLAELTTTPQRPETGPEPSGSSDPELDELLGLRSVSL